MSQTLTPPAQALPIVQGLTFRRLERVAKIDKLIKTPNQKSWAAMLEQIRLTGDMTSATTKSGRNHPCQTADLRCDHQGEIGGGYINTQVQLGGSDVRIERTDAKQSTSVTQVNVHPAAYRSPLIKDALARAHDWSFATGWVAQIDPVVNAAPVQPTGPTRPSTFTCNKCGATYQALDSIALGVSLGGFPARCRCGGTPTR
jgi:hypothetical protein